MDGFVPVSENLSMMGSHNIFGTNSQISENDTSSQHTAEVDGSSQINRCMAALEHSTIKVPYEVLNRKFRTAQKVLEREVSAVAACTSEMQAALSGSPMPRPQQLTQMIRGVMSQVSSLKRKAREAVAGEVECARAVRRRIEHLDQAGKGSAAARAAWESTRIDRLITDFLLREGCYRTAKKLVELRNIKSLTNLGLFENAYEVEQSLERRDVSKCLAWCHENKTKLKKLNSSLEFNIRIQEFIDMIKRNERMSAVWHARKYFSAQDCKQLPSIPQCMALLAFPADTKIPEYQVLLSDSRWQDLIQQFRDENLRLYHLSLQATFTVVVQAGLSALKTPQCYKSNKESFNPDCPVCVPTLNSLAKELPYAHCSQSRLVCFLSGETMNENNLPLMLPNGYVYGSNALEAQAAANNGEVFCPRSETKFQLSDAQKVFVM
ncbi:E3 ubiquitin-protein transferase MAEA isoform X2 [Hyalella azteca]|uniref:E3 ubiquitin-protein transferase MAEA isoform X1 n=1 Tax=Hyalella azteca TaxID=294128 RepID=A0A8B7MZ35_HYAAZ|nr:E3 ubiquitin-protein transferase MAEA isoform X1 [Hyalella azteca]XP_018006817.1 E3 ubiquitin-protein transferase MAEA isoform X2 [Hyalella azteca]